MSNPPENVAELRELERPSKTLFVRNVNYSTTEEEIREVFEKYGPVEEVFSRISTRGMVFVTFMKLEDAEKALQNLQDFPIRGRPIDLHYSVPKEEVEKKQISSKYLKDSLFITLRGTNSDLTTEDVTNFFSQFGKIKRVREWSKRDQKIVEFYDSRDCEQAKQECDGAPFKGGNLFVQFALNNKGANSSRGGRPPGPQRREREGRGRSTPYDRIPGRDSNEMNYRPIRSGVSNMIQDFASTIQQQTSENQMRRGYPPSHSYHYDVPPPHFPHPSSFRDTYSHDRGEYYYNEYPPYPPPQHYGEYPGAPPPHYGRHPPPHYPGSYPSGPGAPPSPYGRYDRSYPQRRNVPTDYPNSNHPISDNQLQGDPKLTRNDDKEKKYHRQRE